MRLRKEKLSIEHIPLTTADAPIGEYARTPRYLFLFDQEVKTEEQTGENFDDINYRNLTAIVNHGKELKKISLWSHF